IPRTSMRFATSASRLVTSCSPTILRLILRAESNGVGTGTTTYMNSTKTTSGGGVKSSPTENFVHELKHAALKDTGSHPADRNEIDPSTGNPKSEQPSLDMQNEYRRGTGETQMRERY